MSDITEEMIEAGARAMVFLDWDPITQGNKDLYRHQARCALEAALAGRTVIDLPRREVLAGTDFQGCSDSNPDNCACTTWAPLECAACGEELHDGDDIYASPHLPQYPWLAANHRDQEHDSYVWHAACDERGLASRCSESGEPT